MTVFLVGLALPGTFGLYPAFSRVRDTSAARPLRVVPFRTSTTTPFTFALRLGVGDVCCPCEGVGEVVPLGPLPPAPVIPRLSFCGKSLVRPTIPRTTRAARISARRVEVAILSSVFRTGGSCLPAKSLRSAPSSLRAEPPGEPPASASFPEPPQPLDQHGIVLQGFGLIDQPIQQLIIACRGDPEAGAHGDLLGDRGLPPRALEL